MKVRKMFLKSFAIFMAVCMLSGMFGAVNAEESVFNYNEKEVIISGDIDSQKAQLIADTISDKPTISTFGIACIFGHSKANTTVRETNHRYYSTSPRCLQTTYNVTYCTRSGCDYIVYTISSQIRVPCCA